jgi:hypothetical protein
MSALKHGQSVIPLSTQLAVKQQHLQHPPTKALFNYAFKAPIRLPPQPHPINMTPTQPKCQSETITASQMPQAPNRQNATQKIKPLQKQSQSPKTTR